VITIEASELKAVPRLDLQLRALGHETTVVPYLVGTDYLWLHAPDRLCLTQRKKVPGDIISSFQDGRLQRFVEDSPPGSFRCLLLHFPDNLRAVAAGLAYAKKTLPWLGGVLLSIQHEGVYLGFAIDGICGVAEALHGLWEWTGRDQHASLHRCIPPVATSGYDPVYRRQVAALMCTPGFGEELAQRALDGDLTGIGPVRRQSIRTFWPPVIEVVNQILGDETR